MEGKMLRKVKAALIGALLGVLASAPQLVEAQFGVNSEREVVEVSKQVVGAEPGSAPATTGSVSVPSIIGAWPYAVMMLMGLYGGWLLWGRRRGIEVDDAHQLASAGLIDPDRANDSALPNGSLFGLSGSNKSVYEEYVTQELGSSLGLSRISHVTEAQPVVVQSTPVVQSTAATEHHQQLDEEPESVMDPELSVQSTPDIGSTPVFVERELVEVKPELVEVEPVLNTQQEVRVPDAPDESGIPPRWVWSEPLPAALGLDIEALPADLVVPKIIYLDPNENDLDAFASEEGAKPPVSQAKQLAYVRRVG